MLNSITGATFVSLNVDELNENESLVFPEEHHWIVDVLKNGAMDIYQIAKKTDRSLESVIATVKFLWNIGVISTVIANLAVGVAYTEVWHCGIISDDPQVICDTLAERNNLAPERILLIRNGVDGPVVMKRFFLNEDYKW